VEFSERSCFTGDFYLLLCYVTLRYIMLRCAMLCHVMLCYVMLRCVMLCYVTLCCVTLRCVMLRYVVLRYVMFTLRCQLLYFKALEEGCSLSYSL